MPDLSGASRNAMPRPAEGLNCFRDTLQAFLFSLAPGLGIMVAAVAEGLAEGLGGLTVDRLTAKDPHRAGCRLVVKRDSVPA